MNISSLNLMRLSAVLRLTAVLLGVFALANTTRAQSGWVPIKLNTAGHDLNSVYFIDSKRGWVGGDGGFLSRTDDGGQSWIRQSVSTTAAINDIYFRDKEAGFFLAGNSIFVTRDNGSTWTHSKIFSAEEFDGADIELYSLRFSSQSANAIASLIACWFTPTTAAKRGGGNARRAGWS
jgi:photosystem II stability/assembly factor-like uncharacterized protein